jgi:hypothetical protein
MADREQPFSRDAGANVIKTEQGAVAGPSCSATDMTRERDVSCHMERRSITPISTRPDVGSFTVEVGKRRRRSRIDFNGTKAADGL